MPSARGSAAPFNLLTYQEVRPRASDRANDDNSRDAPLETRAGHGAFGGARRLRDHQIALIRRWASDGALQGDPGPAGRPARTSDWHLGNPIRSWPCRALPLSGSRDVFRTFVVPVPASVRRYVNGLEFRAGGSTAIHHANIKIDRTRASRRQDEEEAGPGFEGGAGRDSAVPDGHFLGWSQDRCRVCCLMAALQLEPNSDLVVEAHLMPAKDTEPVRINVGLYFTNEAPISNA